MVRPRFASRRKQRSRQGSRRFRALVGCAAIVSLLASGCTWGSSGKSARGVSPSGKAGGLQKGASPGVAPTGPRLAWTSPRLDGLIYARPVVAGSEVLVATENDSVYALSITDGSIVWRTHLGAPMPAARLACGNIDPSGITGTPALDPAAGVLYAVALLQSGHHVLYALDARTGKVRWQAPADPPGADPLLQQQRAGLTLSRGRVYIPYGGLFGDCGNYHGWVVALHADGTGAMADFRVPTRREGGIWAPSGAVVDGSGDLFVSTGNGDSGQTFDYGNSVLRLSPALHLLDYFAPADWKLRNRQDLDLGSVGPALLQGGLVFQIGKRGIGYLLDASHLGGIGGEIYSSKVCGGAYGGVAYDPPDVYVPCTQGVVALRVEGAAGGGVRFRILWRSQRLRAGPPVVAGGRIWVVDTASARLWALDPGTGEAAFHANLGGAVHFDTPAASGDRILVGAGRYVKAFQEG